MPDYEFDVFISYRRVYPFTDWVRDMFVQNFEAALNQSMPDDARIFLDLEVVPGTQWPARFRSAVRTSKCLVPIWSPQYFRSPWCLSEWKSFAKRGDSRVVPIRWTEKLNYFPAEACAIQMADFSRYALVGSAFTQTELFLDFQVAVKALAKAVAAAVATAPKFDDADPIFEPVDVPVGVPTGPAPKVRLQPMGLAAGPGAGTVP